jgi:hypothetical protein
VPVAFTVADSKPLSVFTFNNRQRAFLTGKKKHTRFAVTFTARAAAKLTAVGVQGSVISHYF